MRGFLGTTAVVVGMGAGSACAQTPGVTGTGATGTPAGVWALSADGTVAVGNTGRAGPAAWNAFRWVRSSPNAGVLTILAFGGLYQDGDQATAVSADGQIVYGYDHFHGAGMDVYQTSRWAPPYTSRTTLSDNGCGYGGVAAVSADGLIVVGTRASCSGAGGCIYEPTFWSVSSSGSVTSHCLSGDPSWGSQTASSVSGDGSVIVGSMSRSQLDTSLNGAYVWRGLPTGVGTVQELPPLPGAGWLLAGAHAVSRDGAFAAGSSYLQGTHPVRWALSGSAPGPAEDLMPPGWYWAFVNALNEDGSVGAGAGSDGADTAFWWTSRTGVVNLNTYLTAHGVDLTGWHLDYAACLSDDGFTVGGYGQHNGQREGFVVVMPRCGSADFDHDGDTATDADIEAFFACLAGSCCAGCESADFNWDGSAGTDADIEAFFRVLAGGAC
jgi:hypothetical protein